MSRPQVSFSDTAPISDSQVSFDNIATTPEYLVSYSVPGGSITFNSANRTVKGCYGEITEAHIPAEINFIPVAAIGGAAFYNCNMLTSVTIPDRVKTIGDEAFFGCDNLTDIYFSGSEKH